jgi:hypothetical protein
MVRKLKYSSRSKRKLDYYSLKQLDMSELMLQFKFLPAETSELGGREVKIKM